MVSIYSFIFYALIFLSLYVQVFFLVTFLENRKKIITRKEKILLRDYPSVTIAVPCWNEENTVAATVQSLLDLRYPKDKLTIFLIDDGSTDNTWNIIKQFTAHPNIKIFHKKNGGKYTALNLGINKATTEFFGGFDADSIAHPESLVRIMDCFFKDESIMAVAPSVSVHNPKNFLQSAQKAEYHMGVYFKKMLGFLGAINVTPGPLTVFRKKVFEELGPYRQGHNTEDMEIAYRMQKHHRKIEHCSDAYVYTNSPSSVKTLYKQRLRWIYGFINNTIDYHNILFKKKYGNFSFFTLPMGIISIISVTFLFGRVLYSFGNFLYEKILIWNTVGWDFVWRIPHIDLFFIKTWSFGLLLVAIYLLIIFAIVFGRKMTNEKTIFSFNMFYFFPVFGLIAPFWLLRAVFNTITRRKPAWR